MNIPGYRLRLEPPAASVHVMRKTLCALALMLAGCAAEVPMAAPSADTAGRSFAPPALNDAALYVYVADRPQPAVFGVTANGASLGDLASHTWMRVTLVPGAYDIRCTGGRSSTPSLMVDMAPGATRYVELSRRWLEIGCDLREVPAATAQPAILAGKRVRELR